jgi:hypothetical protein
MQFSDPMGSRDFYVQFWYEGYTGAVINLTAADNPFVLREFNTDDDLFKPIRPMMAEINISTDVTGVTVEDFLTNNDTDIFVKFVASAPFIGGLTLFDGILMQDDFQEEWINTTHIITLRASDRFGFLKNVELSDNGAEVVGKYLPFEFIKFCLQQTNARKEYYLIINKLFHDSMSSAADQHPLNQCLIDAKTFQKDSSEYEDSYTVLEKINRAFNQTLFLYNNIVHIVRWDDYYRSYTQNIDGVSVFDSLLLGSQTAISRRFDVQVGINTSIKPIAPQMLRYVKRKTKIDTVEFDYEQYPEIIKNQSFSRGTLLTQTVSVKSFSVNDWFLFEGPISNPVQVMSGGFDRIEEYSASRTLEENYLRVILQTSINRWVRSTPVQVLQNEMFTFSVDVRYGINIPISQVTTQHLLFQLTDNTSTYTLDEDGNWIPSTINWSLNPKTHSVYWNGSSPSIKSDEWATLEVSCKPMPISGILYVSLLGWTTPGPAYVPGNYTMYKNLKMEYTNSANGFFGGTIKSIQSIYTKTDDVKNTSLNKTYLDDGVSKSYKGSIFEIDYNTLTDQSWYRKRYPAERYSLRQQNAIGYWEHNRFNRTKIDGNYFGLFYDDGGIDACISPLNTIRFVDDDINRVYAIANLKEINFANNTWSGTLIEIYNEALDNDISQTFSANYNSGTYSLTGEFKIPLTLQTAGGFVINTGNTAKYLGLTTINSPITCNISGRIINTTPSQTNVTFSLKKNGVAIKTNIVQVFNTNQIFALDMSASSTSIATNDEFTLTVSSNVNQIEIYGGSIQINTPSNTQVFDLYSEQYIYK